MKYTVLLSFLGTYIISAWSLELFQAGPRHVGFGQGYYRPFPSHQFQAYGQGIGHLRDFPSFPIRTPRAIRYGSFSRFWRPRGMFPPRPSFRRYGQRPSYVQSQPRHRMFRIRQSPATPDILPYQSGSRIISRRIGSPIIGQSLPGSRRIVHRIPAIHGGSSRRIVPERRIRLRQPAGHPSVSRNPGVIALFAVDDPRHQGRRSRISRGSLPQFARPHLSETVDKGVKVTAIKKKILKDAVNDERLDAGLTVADKKVSIESTKETIKSMVPIVIKAEKVLDVSSSKKDHTTSNMNNNANADRENTNVEANVAVNDADTVNVVVDTIVSPVAKDGTLPGIQGKDVIVKDIVSTGIKEKSAEIVIGESVAVEQSPVVILEEPPVVPQEHNTKIDTVATKTV